MSVVACESLIAARVPVAQNAPFSRGLDMRTHINLAAACTALSLSMIANSSAAPAEIDACTLLTPEQVSAAAGFPVSAGTHVMPSFVKTCTWTGTNKTEVQFVTLYLQTAAAYDGSKQMASQMAVAGAVVKPAGVGDDSYYFIEGSQVALEVKQGGVAFKVSVYKEIPVDQKEGMELTLANGVLSKL